jgi:hypothetical protein
MKDQLEKVSCLCDTTLYRVKNGTPIQNVILKFLHTAWGTLKKDQPFPPFFPGPQPISIERRHFPILKENEYVACEKTDGVRYMCILTKYEDKKLCVFVNRKLDIFLVSLHFLRTSYDGTILDGELVKNKKNGKWYYLVYDAVMINGEDVKNLNLNERISKSQTVVDGIKKLTKDPITIKMKKFHTMNNLKNFCENYLDKLDFNTDGLVFTPIDDPIRIGTHETLFKWKPGDQNTIDFQLIYRERSWGLYIQEKGNLIFQSEIKHEEAPDWFVERNIVECKYDSKNFKWIPLTTRTDKTYPNNRRTFYRTMVNISENIEMNEFFLLSTS